MQRIVYFGIFFLAVVGVVELHCSGLADHDNNGDASVDGDTDGDTDADSLPLSDTEPDSESDTVSGGVACTKNSDCFFGDCCSCNPVTSAPDCSDLGCPSPDCRGLTAICGVGGTCETVLATCDPAAVVCDALPPVCPGMVPYVLDGCWAPNCILAENCSEDCGETPCPWLCPADGDQLLVVGASDRGGVLENRADGKWFECQVIFDQADDNVDCGTALTSLGQSLIVTGGSTGEVCISQQKQPVVMATGKPQQCTFQCNVL